MPEILAIKVEEGPCIVAPIEFEDLVCIFRSFNILLEDVVFVGIDSIEDYGGCETNAMEVCINGWVSMADYLMSNSPDTIVDAIEDSGEYEFDTKAYGIELIQNLRDSIEGWKQFVTDDGVLNLAIRA